MHKLFRSIISKYHESFLCIGRKLSNDKNILPPKITRSDKIVSAIKLYVSKCNEAERLIENERKEFEFGRKYLAKMMGGDPETFDQNDIDEAIRYLFPSGLFNEKAKPIMTDPSNIYPKKKPLQCDHLGRPYDSFYYTARPFYYKIMHDAAYLLEKLKSVEDAFNKGINQDAKHIELHSTRWLSEEELATHCLENTRKELYTAWLNLMNRIYNHPYNSVAEEFLMSMRVPIRKADDVQDLPQIVVDPMTGRRSVETYGQKKWAMATLRMTMPGTGKFLINNERLLDMTPILSNRECIMFPLQFTDTVGRIDVEATCNMKGDSSTAYAIRLALARALSILLTREEEVTRMSLAGLLTQDERYKERKQPGKPKARKSAPWRPR